MPLTSHLNQLWAQLDRRVQQKNCDINGRAMYWSISVPNECVLSLWRILHKVGFLAAQETASCAVSRLDIAGHDLEPEWIASTVCPHIHSMQAPGLLFM